LFGVYNKEMETLMIHIFTLFFALLSVAVPACASEYSEEIILHANFGVPTAHCLVYSSTKNREACGAFGIESKENEPFFPLSDFFKPNSNETDNEQVYHKFADLEALPVRCLVKDCKELEFKYANDEIQACAMTMKNGNKRQVKMIMATALLNQYDVACLMKNFTKKPGYFLKDEQELVQRGLMAADGGHGPNGIKVGNDQEQEGKIRGCSPEGQMLFYFIDHWRYFVGGFVGSIVGLVILCNLSNKVKSS
jgi:hypothetical protein